MLSASYQLVESQLMVSVVLPWDLDGKFVEDLTYPSPTLTFP
jgi:hypothetical protein